MANLHEVVTRLRDEVVTTTRELESAVQRALGDVPAEVRELLDRLHGSAQKADEQIGTAEPGTVTNPDGSVQSAPVQPDGQTEPVGVVSGQAEAQSTSNADAVAGQ